jgi:hypothetical protein
MNSPVFVMGTPRSGTTLTATILGRHSRIFIPGETHFFEDVYARFKGKPFRDIAVEAASRLMTIYGRFNEAVDQERVDALGRFLSGPELEGCDSLADLMRAFMEAQMRHEGKQRWGNQTPRDIFFVREIMAMFPGAKVVVCTRDPRDFLLSYKGKWKRESGSNAARLKKLYHPVITSMLWKASVKRIPSILGMVPRGDLKILRYEDLVRDPEAAISGVCRTIGENFEPGMLNVEFSNSSHGMQTRGIYGDSVGRWRSGLPKEDIRIAQTNCRSEMALRGYEEEPVDVAPLRLAQCYLSAPGALLSALHANREKRGPLIPYLLRRGRSAMLR